MKKLKIEYVSIESIKPYKGNAKLHTDEQIKQIEESISRFGFDDPIAVWNDEIVEGHGRLIAAKKMGMEEVPIIRLDGLTDEQRRAYTLVHNQLTLNTGFDMSVLEDELRKIDNLDMESLGFDMSFMEEKEPEEKPEIEFSDYIDEESNYIVLKFNNTVDWVQLQSIFQLKTVKSNSTKKDGKGDMVRQGIGRIVDGAEFLNKIGVKL